MKHRLFLVLAASLLVSAALVSGATASRSNAGQLFSFSGELLATPGANATSLSVQVEAGNKPALRVLLGANQTETFTLDANTEILVYQHGVPHVTTTADLTAGDYVTVNVRDPHGSSLPTILATPANRVSEHAAPGGGQPAWLFSGTVAGPQGGGTIALHVQSGNWKALQAMLGQPLDQTFTYDASTIFLLWQGGVPTVIDATQLKAGDNITVRIRAPRSDTLAQVEATPARHVGDHEPAPPPED
jgi:hypothetical protein